MIQLYVSSFSFLFKFLFFSNVIHSPLLPPDALQPSASPQNHRTHSWVQASRGHCLVSKQLVCSNPWGACPQEKYLVSSAFLCMPQHCRSFPRQRHSVHLRHLHTIYDIRHLSAIHDIRKLRNLLDHARCLPHFERNFGSLCTTLRHLQTLEKCLRHLRHLWRHTTCIYDISDDVDEIYDFSSSACGSRSKASNLSSL